MNAAPLKRFFAFVKVPWVAVVALAVVALAFTLLGGLATIATFSSVTFLLVSLGVSIANLRLRSETNSKLWLVLFGIALMFTTLGLLVAHLAAHEPTTLFWLAGFFISIAVFEVAFCHRECETLSTKDHTVTTDPNVNDYEPDVLRIFQSKDQTKAYYNKIAKVYDLLAEHSEQPMREKGLQKLAARPGERILEVGFGTGHSVVELAQAVGPTGNVLGVDISDEMVALTNELLQREGLAERAELTCGDAASLPYKDESLDGIFTSFTFELFDTPEIPKVLAEWMRVLKPGGRLVVVALSKEGEQGVIMKAYEWTHKHFPNLMDCRPIYARRAIEAAGFDVQETDIEHMWVAVEIVLAVKAAP